MQRTKLSIFLACAKFHTSEDVTEIVLEIIETLKLDLENCRDKHFDDVARMSRKYPDLQAGLKK
jgi:hypothetical protein